jgi:hypothetical protein
MKIRQAPVLEPARNQTRQLASGRKIRSRPDADWPEHLNTGLSSNPCLQRHNLPMRSLLLLCITSLSLISCVPALSIVNPDYIDRLQTAISTVWPKMDQLWPGADFSNLTLLLVDGSNAFAINAKGSTKLEYSEIEAVLPAARSDTGYAKLTWRGAPAVVLRVNVTNLLDVGIAGARIPSVFPFVTHEAFHFYVQGSSWQQDAGSGLRAARYPVEATPRLYRYMTFKTLLEAYENQAGRTESIGFASGWYGRWKSEFSNEFGEAQTTDTIEGTAEYATVLATARAAVGFDANPSVFKAAVLEALREIGSGPERFNGVDSESYPLGVIAGLVADTQHPSWKNEAPRGITPLEALLGTVKPLEQTAPAETVNRITSAAQSRQSEAQLFLEPFLNRYAKPETLLLSVPFKAMSGSFTTRGFYQTQSIAYKPIIAPISASFRLSSGMLEVNGVTAALGVVAACSSEPQLILLLAPGEAVVAADRLSLDGGGLKGTFNFTRATETNRSVLCGQ